MIIISNEHYMNYISYTFHEMYVQSFNYIHLYEIFIH